MAKTLPYTLDVEKQLIIFEDFRLSYQLPVAEKMLENLKACKKDFILFHALSSPKDPLRMPLHKPCCVHRENHKNLKHDQECFENMVLVLTNSTNELKRLIYLKEFLQQLDHIVVEKELLRMILFNLFYDC